MEKFIPEGVVKPNSKSKRCADGLDMLDFFAVLLLMDRYSERNVKLL